MKYKCFSIIALFISLLPTIGRGYELVIESGNILTGDVHILIISVPVVEQLLNFSSKKKFMANLMKKERFMHHDTIYPRGAKTYNFGEEVYLMHSDTAWNRKESWQIGEVVALTRVRGDVKFKVKKMGIKPAKGTDPGSYVYEKLKMMSDR